MAAVVYMTHQWHIKKIPFSLHGWLSFQITYLKDFGQQICVKWNPVVLLIWHSLIIGGPSCSAFCEMPVGSFCSYFLYSSSDFLHDLKKIPKYILDNNPFLVIYVANIFSLLVICLFLFMGSLISRSVLSFIKLFNFFPLVVCAYVFFPPYHLRQGSNSIPCG